MANYNFTYDDDSLIYKDAAGNTLEIGSAEGVAETVSAWLEDHVDPDTGYVIDDTLTISGAAADAKATGDNINELKTEIDNIDNVISDNSTLLSSSLTDGTSTSSDVTYTLSGNTQTISGLSSGTSLGTWLGSTTAAPPTWLVSGKLYILKAIFDVSGPEILLQAKYGGSSSNKTFFSITSSGTYIFEAPASMTTFRLATRIASGLNVSGTITLEISNAIMSNSLATSINYLKSKYFALPADDAVTIPDDTDLNSLNTAGVYKVTNITHAGTMSHMPATVAGKLIVNELSQTTRVVQIFFGVASAAPIYVRYYDGSSWSNWDNLAKASALYALADRVSELEKTQFVIYETGTFAEGKASERIIVYYPASTGYIAFYFYHFVDNDINCNGWQVYRAYKVDDNFSNAANITNTGEWECAIKLDGRNDFSGGHSHGDEIMDSFTVIMDGIPVDHTTLTTRTQFKELIVVQTSTLYDPSDHTTAIAEHGKEYVFSDGKLIINQSVKWLVAEALENCFMAMFPASKNYFDRACVNSDFATLQLASSASDPQAVIVKHNANTAVMWDTTSGCFADVSVPVYPTGLTDGDQISISDNSGNAYNKLYFKVCGGGSTSVGELWKSTSVFKLNYKS